MMEAKNYYHMIYSVHDQFTEMDIYCLFQGHLEFLSFSGALGQIYQTSCPD